MGKKSIHGHYGCYLEEEAKRLKKMCNDNLGIELSWREVTDMVAMRSFNTTWDERQLKTMIAKIRGVE